MKITITHYLNKRLKPHLMNDALKYPVYIRVSYGRRNERIRSEWISYPVSEIEFDNNTAIQKLKNYESNVIADILDLKDTVTEPINIGARLRTSTRCVSECFFSWILDEKVMKNQIISYISSKSDLSKDIICPYVRLDHINILGWKELIETQIFSLSVNQKLVYFITLLEFVDKFYPSTMPEYTPGDILTYYEWKNLEGKEKFTKYILSKSLLQNNIVKEITSEFDRSLLKMSSFDIMVEY